MNTNARFKNTSKNLLSNNYQDDIRDLSRKMEPN